MPNRYTSFTETETTLKDVQNYVRSVKRNIKKVEDDPRLTEEQKRELLALWSASLALGNYLVNIHRKIRQAWKARGVPACEIL
ncbi:MAG: hypothetical protein ABSG50_15750 [Opitutaceae bacterium]|jgi:hypothetical protein